LGGLSFSKMKKLKPKRRLVMKTVIQTMVVLIALLFSAYAAEYRGAEIVTVNEGDTLASDLFAGCRHVEIYGFVRSDVYAGCETVIVDGEIGDDLLAGCREARITGKVGDGVIFFGQSIYIDGEVGGDVLAFGERVRISERGVIKGNLFVGSGNLLLEGGRVEGNIRGGAGRTHLDGIVGKDVDIETGSIKFGEGYQAAGGTKLTLHKELDEKNAGYVPDDLEVTVQQRKRFFQGAFFYWSLIAMFIVGVLIVAFFKNFSRDYLGFTKQEPWKNMGLGFLVTFIAPVGIVILMLLIFTIPVYLSFVFTALALGDYLFGMLQKNGSARNLIWPLLVGVIIVMLASKIPFIGWLFSLVIISFGMGSFIAYIWKLKQINGTQTA